MARWQGEAMQPAIALRGMRDAPLRSQAAYLVRIGRERLAQASSSPPSAADLLDDNALAVLGGAASELPDDDRPQARGDVLPGRLGALLADLGFVEQSGPAGGVALLDLAQARGLAFDEVIVLGLEDGTLPGHPAPDPYLPDDLRDRLGLLPPRAPGTTEALLRFHAACACATDAIDARAPLRRRRRPRARALALLGRDAPAAGRVRADSRVASPASCRPSPPPSASATSTAGSRSSTARRVPPWRRRWAAARACADSPAV